MHIPVFRIYTNNYTVSDCSNGRTYRRILVDGAMDSFLATLLIIAGVYLSIVFER
jgi:hypothetical protein